MITCIAIDDEPNALEVLEIHISKISNLVLSGKFTDPIKASQYLEENSVDLLFLDINMKGLNGFELLESLTYKPKVIFTTAYSEYAVQSYNVSAIDYLVKPIPFSRFLKAVKKVSGMATVQKDSNESPMLTLKSGTTLHRVRLDDIILIEADGNYCKFITKESKIMVLCSLKEAIKMLNDQFRQTHRSYIINVNMVDEVEVYQLKAKGHIVPISGSFRKQVLQCFTK